MQKKLLAVAVAGALLAPAAAMAQSSVTISGVFKVGIDNYKISGGRDDNDTRITDNSSRIIFGITEDLGGGLSAIAQLDARPQLDDTQAAPTGATSSSALAAGNSWVGIRSNNLGTLTLGRHDLHYGKQPDETAARAGALMAASVSLMDFIGTTSIANATRTPNVIRWDSPNWGGFSLTAAFSTNPFGDEAALPAAAGADPEDGSAWTFNPSYTASNFQIGYSYWDADGDAATAATQVEQKSHVLYGYYRFGAFKVGAAVNQSEREVGGAATHDRRAWTIPVAWTSGPHHVAGHYTIADDNDVVGSDSGAKMFAVAYSYSLSKRTSMGVTLARLTNDTLANYNFFTNTGSLGSTNSALGAGEDGRLMAFTVRHAF